MLTVHHLNDSRSQRVLWLLEELGTPYEIRHYARNATTRLAPPELMAVHPLGKSPVVEDDGLTVIESGAIVDYILRRHGGGRLQPAAGSREYEVYNQWLHYAEGSGMLPLMLQACTPAAWAMPAAPLKPRIDSELANHLGYREPQSLDRPRLPAGQTSLTGADIQMSFVGEAARDLRVQYPAMDAWVRRLQARPAYQPRAGARRAVRAGQRLSRPARPASGHASSVRLPIRPACRPSRRGCWPSW